MVGPSVREIASRYRDPEDPSSILAVTDGLCRREDQWRWGVAGWIYGSAARSVYMAMSSIFITPHTIVMTPAELKALWRRNQPTIDKLKAHLPHLATARGEHYADVLLRLLRRRLDALQDAGAASAAEAASPGRIDKTVLALPAPKRIRASLRKERFNTKQVRA